VLALAGAYFAQYGLPTAPFGDDQLRAHERLFWMLVPAGFACLSAWRHALLPVALLLPLVALNLMGGWSGEVADWTPRVLLPLGFALACESGEAAFRRRPGFEASLALGLVASASAVAIGATGSASYATWAGGLGLAWGLAVLFAWRSWDANLLDGGTLMTWTAGFLALAATYSDLEPLDAVLLGGALPLSLFTESLGSTPCSKRVAAWSSLLLVFALVGLRIALGFEPDPYAS